MPGTISQHIPKELLAVVLKNQAGKPKYSEGNNQEGNCLGKLGSGR